MDRTVYRCDRCGRDIDDQKESFRVYCDSCGCTLCNYCAISKNGRWYCGCCVPNDSLHTYLNELPNTDSFYSFCSSYYEYLFSDSDEKLELLIIYFENMFKQII